MSVTYSLRPAAQVTVTNNDSSRPTGMVITVSCGTPVPHQGTEGIWFGSGANFHYDLPLETGQRRSFLSVYSASGGGFGWLICLQIGQTTEV